MSLKSTANPFQQTITEEQVFSILDHLQPTAEGYDKIPAWFLRLLAPVCSRCLAHLINLSLCNSFVPPQWKIAVIHPVPKTKAPQAPADYRPTLVVPILSRIVERLVVHAYLYPALSGPEIEPMIKDQFAFRPTGSTTVALIDLFQQLTILLQRNEYVMLVSVDFTHAFDTIRHQTLVEKMAVIYLPNHIYNWMAAYFHQRGHVTKILDVISIIDMITASIIQRSVVGLPSYVVAASGLHPILTENSLMKYADDTYLLVGSSKIDTLAMEFDHIKKWAATNNLRLNPSKTRELIIYRKRPGFDPLGDPLLSGATRVGSSGSWAS